MTKSKKNKINYKKVDDFWRKRAKVDDPRISTHFKRDDTHIFDLRLIKKHIKPHHDVLDLACGTCYLSNELVDKVNFIKAVDKYPQFLSYCTLSPKLKTEAKDILKFEDKRKYDIILLFGIMMYFNDSDTRKIYAKCKRLLKKGGIVVVKHQCGIKEDVVINKYSELIGEVYYANYKWVKKDEKLLREFFSKVKTIDIYPKRLNPWPNTHFYAFVCRN